MKTIKQFLSAVYLLLSLSAFGESPVSSQVDTDRVGRPSLQAGADDFPENFPLTDAAIISYYNDTVTRGYSSVYGPAVLEPVSGKSFATAVGNDGGGAILRRLLAQPLSFRIANPKDNYVVLQANLQNSDGQVIFAGARGYQPVLGEKGPSWYIPMDADGVQLFLSEKLPGLKIPKVDAIHIVPKKSDGGWAGEDYWVNRNCDDRGCSFNFDLNKLPAHGQVILIRYEKAGAVEKSYDIGTGAPSEVTTHSLAFNGGVYGMRSFTDLGMAPGAHLKMAVTVHRWEKSPLLHVVIERSDDIHQRPIEIAASMVDENGNVVALATNVQFRKVGADQLAWSDPINFEKGNLLTGSIGEGQYYFIFGWPDGTFPDSDRKDPGDGKGVVEPVVY